MFDVAVLVERALEPLDADQLIALHEGLEESVTYHLLRPVESSAAVMASSLGALGGTEVMPTSQPDLVREVQDDVRERARGDLTTSTALLQERGQQVRAHLTEEDPVEALTVLVGSVRAAEAIILTEPHLVRELLHLDWTSRARRRLDVPTLHLLEHVPFSGQAQG